MSTTFELTDDAIREAFERRAQRGSARDLSAAILAQTASLAQDRSWRTRLRGVAHRGWGPRILVLALLVAALLAVGLAVVGGRPATPAPLHAVPYAPRPFEYRVPAGIDPVLVRGAGAMVAFTEGGGDEYGRDAVGRPIPGARGVTVSSAHDAMTHACRQSADGRAPLREDPLAFIDDLRTIGGAGLGEPTPVTFDGHPAFAVTVDPAATRCTAADFHVLGGGLNSGFVMLSVPSRLIVTEVDGMTIVLQAWAHTQEELDAWLPVATEFLDSVHFTTRP